MRKKRLLKTGAKYLISVKTNKGEEIFKAYDAKDLFIKTVERSKEKFQFSIKKPVFMSNQIIFEIKPENNESLSKIMQWILSAFAMKYNVIHNFEGHVWAGNYYSEIVK